MYGAILFDFDDTLVNYGLTRDRACAAFAREHLNGIAEPSAFVGAFRAENDAIWARFITDSPGFEGVLEASYSAAARRLGLDDFADSGFAEKFLVSLCACPVYEPGAIEILDFLRKRCRIGIVTNGLKNIQRRRIEAAGLASRCSGVAISGDLGFEKPDKRIFDYCLSALGVDPADALYVGDSLQTDLAGARNAGLDFCHYNSSGPRHAIGAADRDGLAAADGTTRSGGEGSLVSGEPRRSYEIHDLAQLEEIVGNGAMSRSRSDI